MTELFQIWYKPEHLKNIYPFAIPFYNEDLTIYFENDVIKKLVTDTVAERIGVASWKLAFKMRSRVGLRTPLTAEALNSEYDVLAFTKNSKKHQMMAMANAWHVGFIPTIKLLWEKLGLKMPGETRQPVYQNHFIAKREIYQDYVNNFLSPAMKLIETDEELNKMMIQPSGYGKLSRESDLKSVKAKLGMEDYPICPFILERCPSLWFDMKRINVSYL